MERNTKPEQGTPKMTRATAKKYAKKIQSQIKKLQALEMELLRGLNTDTATEIFFGLSTVSLNLSDIQEEFADEVEPPQ